MKSTNEGKNRTERRPGVDVSCLKGSGYICEFGVVSGGRMSRYFAEKVVEDIKERQENGQGSGYSLPRSIVK